jgi:transcriptional regulator with XRE-family HTH domain
MKGNIEKDIEASYKRQSIYQKQSAKAVLILDKEFSESVHLNLIKINKSLGFSKPSASKDATKNKNISVRRAETPNKIIAWAVAQRIKIAREEQGLNQDELARKTGIARPNIVRIEKGRHMPTYTTLLKVANVLNLDINHLLAKPSVSTQDMAEFAKMAELGIDEWSKQLDAEDKA